MTPRLNLAFNLAFAGLIASLFSLQAMSGRRHAPADPLPLAMQMMTPAPPPLPVVITPSGVGQNGATARRGRNGHFVFDTTVNGVHVPMMFDTGATLVALRAEDAARVGIDVNALRYFAASQTANGTAEYALVTIETLTIGNITRHDVQASVAKPGKLFVNLLGQSFMRLIAGYNVEGDELILKSGG